MVVTSVDWVRAYVPHGEACLVNRVHTCPIGQPPSPQNHHYRTSYWRHNLSDPIIMCSSGMEHS